MLKSIFGGTKIFELVITCMYIYACLCNTIIFLLIHGLQTIYVCLVKLRRGFYRVRSFGSNFGAVFKTGD